MVKVNKAYIQVEKEIDVWIHTTFACPVETRRIDRSASFVKGIVVLASLWSPRHTPTLPHLEGLATIGSLFFELFVTAFFLFRG